MNNSPHVSPLRLEMIDELATLRTQLKSLEADAAVMREALEKCHNTFLTLEILKGYSTEVPPNIVLRAVINLSEALSTSSGKSLLERLKEAEELLRLLEYPDVGCTFRVKNGKIHRWLDRRDAFLNPTEQRK